MSKSFVSIFLLLFTLHIVNFQLVAQKHFRLSVQLPKQIDYEKVEVWLDNGKTDKQISSRPIKDGRLVLTGDYYAMYAVVLLQYPQNPLVNAFATTFFLQEKPATITFHPSHPTTPFENYSLKNVLDFKVEKAQLDAYASTERKKAMDYEVRYGDSLFTSSDTAVRNHYFKVLRKDLGKKMLQYVIRHPDNYYSFYTFRSELIKHSIASSDTMLLAFNTFPIKFRFSDEGNYLNIFLHGRLLSEKKGRAVDFIAHDLNGRKVTLSHFNGKKCVLLHFWATWCTPCMRELPAIKEISKQYGSKGLQIISIALKSTVADHRKTINKQQMDWIHIYNDPDLINQYGNSPVPRICLIDKAGNLIYDKYGFADNDDSQLRLLKESINKLLNQEE